MKKENWIFTQLRIPADLREWIRNEAEEQERSMNYVMWKALESFRNKRESNDD